MTGVNTLPETINTTDSIKSLLEELNNNTPLTTELLNLTWAPTWINNVTRLNAQNLQEKLYSCLKANYTSASNTTVKLAYEQIQRVLNFVAGVRSDPQSTSEVHNNHPGFEPTNNQATGKFQTVFGVGNETGATDAQFILGTYADSTVENSLFIVGVGSSSQDKGNAVIIKTDGTTTFYKDVKIQSSLEVNKVTITGDIQQDSDATTKKYVDTAIANITAIIIRNKGEIEATFAKDPPDTPDKDKKYVQDVASRYIITNYNRDPKNFDGLILTIIDAPTPKDRILYVYIEQPDETSPGIWINAGINSVDLSNYYTKEEIDNMRSEERR